MTNEERDLITGLFNRLRSADTPQKDREAEQLIQQSTTAQPTAPYLLVQTVLVQEHALANATTRIQQLEKQLADAAKAGGTQSSGQHEGGVGGFLSGLFGGHSAGSTNQPAAQSQPARPQQAPPPMPQQYPPQAQGYAQPAPPYPSTVNMPASGGGSFLKSALGTAAGVAGGAMLFQGIQNLMGHNAGPFGGGGGFFGGGGSGFGGGFGGPEIIENREVVNNYYDERGNRDDSNNGGNSSFLGGNEEVGFHPSGDREDNRRDDANSYDTGNSGDTDGNGPLYSTPPTDDPANSTSYESGDTDGDGPLYSTPPTDDDSGSTDNSYDSGNTDTGGYDGGGSDDSSYV